MNSETSTLILLSDIARRIKIHNRQINTIVKKSIKKNEKHKVVTIDVSEPPAVIIRFSTSESDIESTLSEEKLDGDILNLVKEYMDKGRITVLVYLSEKVKERINLRAVMTWTHVHNL